MKELILNAEIRTIEEKTKELRSARVVPAVVYGKHQEPILLKLDNSEFLRAFRKFGESHIITLKAGKENIEVLIHDIQREPVSGDFLHIDFYAITRGEKVHTNIALNFIGTSQAVKEGAVLDEHIKEIEVKVLPRDLVDSFEVDLSILKEIGSSIKLIDLNIDSEKFEILTSIDVTLVTAAKPAKMEVVAEVIETEAENPEK